MDSTDRQFRRPSTEVILWWSIAAGPLAWACDLAFRYSITLHVCATGHAYLWHASTLAAILLALSGTASALFEYWRIPADADESGGRPQDRGLFQLSLGLIASGAFTLAIIAAAFPSWMSSPCK